MEENLRQLETTYGAPASVFERSAAARAKASGTTTEAVVAQWVGQDEPPVVPDSSPSSDSAAADGGDQAPIAPEPSSATTAVGGLSGAALLAAVAEARGMPESLIERSAKARASAAGGSVDDVLLEWAEEDGIATSGPSPASDSSPSGGSAAEGGGGGQASTVSVSGADVGGGGQASTAPAGVLSGAALLAAVAEARRMPESLIERSAAARAKTAGVDIGDILRDWAAEEGIDVSDSSHSDSSPSSQIPPPQGEVPPPGGGGGQASTAPEPSSDTPAAGALSGAALLAAVAKARKMPDSLVERSAKARAKSAGGSVDDVLLEWAQEEGIDVSDSARSSDSSASDSSPSGGGGSGEAADGGGQTSTASVPGADVGGGGQASTAPAGALSGAALLAAVAKARKMPDSLVERSAKARAKSAGGSVDDVLLEWAEEEGIDVGGSDRDYVPAVDQPEDLEELVDASDVGPAPKVDIPSPVEPEPAEEPEPEEPASPRSRYPAWLAAVLIIIPLLAVLYVVVVPNQPTCGSAGQLAIDPATGNAVGCDGGEYGVDAASNLSAGAAIYDAGCAVCHGPNGGGGAGPAMAGGAVLVAFPEETCASHIEWIALGSADWPDATYGANDTPVAGGMPGFEGQLTELEIAQVTLFERVEFGGLDVEAAETACGFEVEEG